MDNQHRKIKGYRELSQEEIDLMNEIKELGQQADALTEKLVEHIAAQELQASNDIDPSEDNRLGQAEPGRWLTSGKADLQTGLMKLTRSVAQPTFF